MKIIKKPIKILIVDDSPVVRKILSRGLSVDPNLSVVGMAEDPYIARDKIVQLKPDVLTLDVDMPRMNGVEFLKRLMPQYPIPVIMVSALTEKGKKITLEALDAGAVDFITKPSTETEENLHSIMLELRSKIKIAGSVDLSKWKTQQGHRRPGDTRGHLRKILGQTLQNKIVAIGASTGGTQAIRDILSELPASMPGIVIVQHMPPGFTKIFANRLNEISDLHVKEAESGDIIEPGVVLLAPGDKHMSVISAAGAYHVVCRSGEKVNGHCPSVDVLMHSVAESVGNNALGIMLTGMGADGAKGMLAMKKEGAINFAQDEATSVVFGMPKEAYSNGGAQSLIPLEKIASTLVGHLG